MTRRIIVQYLNQAGAKEIGLDAGGLFKEFWTDLSELSFNLNYALFRETEGKQIHTSVLLRLKLDQNHLNMNWKKIYLL